MNLIPIIESSGELLNQDSRSTRISQKQETFFSLRRKNQPATCIAYGGTIWKVFWTSVSRRKPLRKEGRLVRAILNEEASKGKIQRETVVFYRKRRYNVCWGAYLVISDCLEWKYGFEQTNN